MPRIIFPLPVFERRLVKFLKFHPEMDSDIEHTLESLKDDIFTPSLKTHKLHGKMKDSYACSIDNHYRIAFSFDKEYIYLESIGNYDDVY